MSSNYDEVMRALESIAKKDPRKVGVNEAADMACEFHAIAVRTLQKLNASGAQDAGADWDAGA